MTPAVLWIACAPALLSLHRDDAPPRPLLPDLVVRPADLYDHDLIAENGRLYLRFATAVANGGEGPLHLYGGTVHADGTRDVMQRIRLIDGSTHDRLAGRFTHHPSHPHLHVDGWTRYRLRLPGLDNQPGAVVAESVRTSQCIIDLEPHDRSLPGAPAAPVYADCESPTQGISVGWAAYDARTFSGQRLDVTALAPGLYWLEAEADPLGAIEERDEANNVARILVSVGLAGFIPADPFEPNETRAAVESRPFGGVGSLTSPNLGPCGPRRAVEHLTLHAATDADLYRFFVNSPGGPDDFVRIDFSDAAGDLELALLDESGAVLEVSAGTTNAEMVALSGRPAGWYFARVAGSAGATSPSYTLTVDPPQNAAPGASVLWPDASGAVVRPGEPFTLRWSAADPEGGPMWVTVYLNEQPAFDGEELLVEASRHTPAAFGAHTIPWGVVPPGEYRVACVVSDGGTAVAAWSAGTVRFAGGCRVDMDGNGSVGLGDFLAFRSAFVSGDPAADFDDDGTLTLGDFIAFRAAYVLGCP